MAFGLGVLSLTPAQFWEMTPRELDAALTPGGQDVTAQSLSHSELQQLMQRFPDHGDDNERCE
jgi:uncharacterized phage protein (TIGR02216 family)